MLGRLLKPKSAVWALDFGEHSVIAVAGRERSAGQWSLVGEGRSRALGRSGGEIVKLSDVVESVTDALRQAEKSAGLRCRRLYFNFDDAGIVSAHPCGYKSLSGEGQIRREDVRDASGAASRSVGDFEHASVYTREVRYLIDGRDSVGNPLGVFGHRLDVTLHVLLARSRVLEMWKHVMRRAQVERSVPILSLDSVCQATLERKAPGRVLWDLGDDFMSGGVVEKGVLREYAVFLSAQTKWPEVAEKIASASREWMGRHGVVEPLVVTGDWAGPPAQF
jgi:cell division protein FtsA